MSVTFKNLFGIYYNLYRGEAVPPSTTDDEWVIALRNYNDAIYRLAAMDDTKWNFLFSTLQSSTQVSPALVKTISAGTTTYVAPTDMSEPGGMFTLAAPTGGSDKYGIIQPHEAQTLVSNTMLGWFSGDQQAGFTLNLTAAPTSSIDGYALDYTYYRKPNLLIASTDDGTLEDGNSIIEGADPAYFYNHMLAQRLKVDENWNGYQTAMRDAEEALKNMRLKNNSGSYYNPWTLMDTSGSGWGI